MEEKRIQAYAARLARDVPGIPLETLRLDADGQYNDVLVVNDAFVFRFAKVAPAVATLAQEVRILRHIGPLVPLPVPNPIYVNLEGRGVGEAYMGYRMLPGVPLWRPRFHAIGDETVLERVAQQLAHFLKVLHTAPVAALAETLPREDDVDYYGEMYLRIRARLFPHMRAEARREVAAHFEPFLKETGGQRFVPVLRHGDFGTGNILFAPETGRVTGIVDFGAAALGDAAGDFASLWAAFGDAFLQRCTRYYPLTEAMARRAAFYRGTFALEEALFGAEYGDDEAFRAGMAAYV